MFIFVEGPHFSARVLHGEDLPIYLLLRPMLPFEGMLLLTVAAEEGLVPMDPGCRYIFGSFSTSVWVNHLLLFTCLNGISCVRRVGVKAVSFASPAAQQPHNGSGGW